MSHRRTLIATLVLAVGATACGSAPEVVLQAEPVAVVDEPAPSEPVVPEPLVPEPAEADEVEPVAPAPAPTAERVEPAAPAPAPTPEPVPEAASPEPEFEVDEDGCVTDVALGLVITCFDPAAGPD